MSDTNKRLDLRFGSFACSVRGFDDPVQPVQQLLLALQQLLEETPELSDAGISFDAETIERLIEEVARRADLDSEQIEITPGLVIVHHGGGGMAATDGATADTGKGDNGGEDWSRPFVSGAEAGPEAGSSAADVSGAVEIQPAESGGDAGEGVQKYVNIFAPTVEGDDGSDDADTSAPIAARLDEAAQERPPDDIFAAVPGPAGDSIFADPMAAEADRSGDGGEAPANFFAAPTPDPGPEDAPEAAPEDASDGAARAGSNVIASFELRSRLSAEGPEAAEDAGAGENRTGEDSGDVSGRVEALFGTAEDQPEDLGSDDGFTAAGLAKAAGAETVQDLLVSAAAWLVLIKGRTTFTRRDVMDVFDGMPGEHSKSLEARIKGFGKAVRNEQMVMIEDGVFGLSQIEIERFQGFL